MSPSVDINKIKKYFFYILWFLTLNIKECLRICLRISGLTLNIKECLRICLRIIGLTLNIKNNVHVW